MNRPMRGNALLERLHELGICPKETRRVVIDVQWNDVVMVYVEHIDASGLLQLTTDDLKGAMIKVVGQ